MKQGARLALKPGSDTRADRPYGGIVLAKEGFRAVEDEQARPRDVFDLSAAEARQDNDAFAVSSMAEFGFTAERRSRLRWLPKGLLHRLK